MLWHTTVEEESPSEVAPLFGLTANATAVLASRAREGLKQAYLQAHVNSALTSGGDCAQYADRLGAYARGGLRMRAERGLRKHLSECVKCRLAAGELAHVNAGIPALLPVAVIGWFAAGYSVKAAGIVAGGAAGAAGAGAAAAATGGASSGSGGAAGGAALSEGLGAPVKVGLAAVLAIAATAGLVWAFAGQTEPVAKPKAKPPATQPALPVDPPPAAPAPRPAPAAPRPAPKPPVKAAAQPKPPSKAAPTPTPSKPRPKPPLPTPEKPAPTPSRSPDPTPKPPPAPSPSPSPSPTPSPTPPAPEPKEYQLSTLQYGAFGDHTGPEVRLGESSWLWQRTGLNIGGQRYGHGATVHARSSVVIDLNRNCSSYDALVGIDDMTLTLGAARFSVYGDGVQLWSSPVIRGGDAAVPVHVSLTGLKTVRLVVEPHTAFDSFALADWAMSRISCS